MAKEFYPNSQLPIRRTVELLPQVFQTPDNTKFMAGVIDPLVQPGVLEKTVGYIGRRYGKTFNGTDVYLDDDQTLRSRYQLEPGVVVKNDDKIESFYDYIDFKNQIKFFNNNNERDDSIVSQDHYTWNPPIDWDKFINYREYYWVPEGPPAVRILGQAQEIVSTYKVALGTGPVWIFTPDGLTNNPTITLYRGQKYKFIVNAPGEGFVIKTNYDTGSLLYNTLKPYTKGQEAIIDEKLYKAKTNIPSASPLNLDQWELVSDNLNTALYYNKGITNNGTEDGILEFEVPFDAPDVLFYQGSLTPDRFGRFLISTVDTNTKIDVEKEILGKVTYTSSNNVTLSNGMVLRFEGKVLPERYSTDTWLVEGVGERITLTRFQDLVVSTTLTKNAPEILFDNEGFDSQPFDDASAYPVEKDYITISKSSVDDNPWSRYNRWFHRSVLDYSHSFNNSNFEAVEGSRAKRPIIEFKPNIQLFNHGSTAKTAVDYIDDFTSDVFSTIEGQSGYIVDGEFLFEGARLLVVADRDSLANNRIYEVKFINHNNSRQISLVETSDSVSLAGEGVLVRRGLSKRGLMYHFNGIEWVRSQTKTSVNQSPMFDVFDKEGVSFGNNEKYPVSTFVGSKLLSYKAGNGVVDTELGFSLSYLNIDNVGDIQFDYDFDFQTFTYQNGDSSSTKKLSTGFYKFNPDDTYENGWVKLKEEFTQPIIDTVIISEETSSIKSSALYWKEVSDTQVRKILFFLNGIQIRDSFTRDGDTFTFEQRSFKQGDTLTIKVYANADPNEGYYEIPLGLEKNPLNQDINNFTLGQAADHVQTALELVDDFDGKYPGISNLRDLGQYQNLSKRFLKHSSIAPVSVLLLCDKETNIIKSVQYAKRAYTDFKNNFLELATQLYYDQNTSDFVDLILEEISRSKNSSNAFADSDMIGSGAYTPINYVVEDEGIKTFALSKKFDLDTLSSTAVYVYVNGTQLLYGRDYDFNSTFGFVNLKIELVVGDKIQIREYVSTGINFIPPTPTKLGLYKKYTPMKFVDDTYQSPREVIQGHDGSITACYGDFRDDVLLELEHRIYNNIKQKYDETVFDIDKILGGYYGNALYDKSQLDSIISSEFLKWISNTNVDYVNNIFFDSENSFTYTYSNMTDPPQQKNLPGYWRGVYKWFYDTDRPHRCPWEMLGFSEQPDWWENLYGPAPYTSNNLILWEDIRDGIIRQGNRAGVHDRYKRPSIMSHIPVDSKGKLLSPLDSGLANNFTLINNKGNFVFGDVSPSEYAWRASSEWPFAIVMALCLMKPFEYIGDNFNKSNVSVNKLGQTVNVLTDLFDRIENLKYDHTVSGLVLYVIDYLKNRSAPLDSLSRKLQNIDIRISNRISGFVDKAQQKYLLDSKSPKSTSSSIFVPQENYDIIFNVSCPISTISYSGVIIEKTSQGWKISGYDNLNPYFNYFEAVPSQTDPLVSVGGMSENFLDWSPEKFYGNGIVVRYNSNFYRSLKSHTSADVFESANWKQLPGLPMTGAVEAYKRRAFNKLKLKKVLYGQIFDRIQPIVDFLLGYQEYLKSIGMVFDGYNSSTQEPYDWFTSCKEFMFWSKHNWSLGSLLTLSPAADSIDVNVPVGVADSILDSFYDYQILKNDGTPLLPQFINVKRDFKKITLSKTNTNDGIYFFRLNYVLKEHVVVFDDRTVFNDIIYDKTTGYRQERIKVRGFRTVDWDGDYTSPGFLFDNVNIETWKPFVDYKLGDIVAYKSYYWTSKFNQLGVEVFDETKWSKLDTTPTKGLVSNIDYRISQFADYYETDTDGIGSSQRGLARHSIGYQEREYLQNIAEDEISQFRIYQGFIREKGTANSIVKVFDKLSKTDDDSVVLNEEWAFAVGRFGGIDQLRQYEFEVNKDEFVINPQPIFVVPSKPSTIITDQYLRIDPSRFTIAPSPFTTNLNLKSYYEGLSRSAGYVGVNQTEFVVKNRDEILNVDISKVNDNDHFWVTFDNYSWTVLRFNYSTALQIVDVKKEAKNIIITFNQLHSLKVGEIIGIRDIQNLSAFHKIISATNKTVTVLAISDTEPLMLDSSSSFVGLFTEARFSSYEDINPYEAALYKDSSKLWIDDNGQGNWEVVQKKRQYSYLDLIDYGITAPQSNGTSVLYIDNLKQIISSMPQTGFLMVYTEKVSATSQGLGAKQIIPPPSGFDSAVSGVFGEILAVSSDNKWLAVGSPLASGVRNKYRGELSPATTYLTGDVVLYNGKLWEAINDIDYGDGTSIIFESQDWTPAKTLYANTTGTNPGYTEQGMVTLYRFVDQQWEEAFSFVSPRQAAFEKFGSSISIGVQDGTYYMAISATGSVDNRGRVYLYSYSGTDWEFLENTFYAGLYSSSNLVTYPVDTIVWYEGNLWQALQNNVGGEDITINSSNWKLLDSISTQCSLPTNVSIDDDGSTLAEGLLTDNQLAELVKQDDLFGHRVRMNRDGKILVISAPNSDGQYFANYKGVWNEYQEYKEGDVVKYQNSYHKLIERGDDNPLPDSTTDSTIVSKGDRPDAGNPWFNVGDSTSTASGKIYIYHRSSLGRYNLIQTINTDSLVDINDTDGTETISSGDQFGFDVDIDLAGTTIIVSSPVADINNQNQGSVYIFRTNDLNNPSYRLKQKIESYEFHTNELFGSSVSISSGTERIVVGARNSKYTLYTGFSDGTTFDKKKTIFFEPRGYPGQVYVFERRGDTYLLVEKLETNFGFNESFGASVDCTNSVIVVGSPTFKDDNNVQVGKTRLFKKNPNENSLNLISSKQPSIDVSNLRNVELYDNVKNIKLQDLDTVDHFKLKILNVAEREINYKTIYDPAVYSQATENETIDDSQLWLEKNVGKVWWDLSTIKYFDYEQGDVSYRIGNWNRPVPGSSIDVYEWVESPLKPSDWSIIADTVEGLALGISGQPKYPNDNVYNVKVKINPNTGEQSGSLYYFWVKNKTTLPNKEFRKTSVSSVKSLIENPIGSGIPFLAIIDSDKLLAYNLGPAIQSGTALINIEYQSKPQINLMHREYQLLTEGVADSLPTQTLEDKWIDSLVGVDKAGNSVPDPTLPEKQKYGLSFRPRQTMFVDKNKALKIVIDNVNSILKTRPFKDTLDFKTLNSEDGIPAFELNQYDVEVENYIDLKQVGTVRIRKAVLSANIVNGQIDTIDIVDPGFGYRVVPDIEISGSGIGAQAIATLDNQGRINSVTMTRKGRKYTDAVVNVRPFSVLVRNDNTADNFWSVYAWDQQRRIFYRSKSQGYDVKKYWEYIDWWEQGYSSSSRIIKEVESLYQVEILVLKTGDLIRVKEFADGGWAVLEKTEEGFGNFLGNFNLVGREGGTIQIKDTLYNRLTASLGYDTVSTYDNALYDLQPVKELRIILQAVKEDIFVDDLRVEWNKLFFSSVRYAFSEQQYVDWAFKTSFLNAIHNVGPLEKKVNYKNDNLDSFRSYIEEVKPFRTTIREYTSRYTNLELTRTAMTDFDLPPAYSAQAGSILPVNESYNRFDEYPWKSWTDNNGYSIVSIEVSNSGGDYTSAPRVIIEGNGSGASAIAYISSGKVSGIKVLTQGSGYTKTPTVLLVGGNGNSTNAAKAVAILGDSKVRSFDLSIKFDRISKEGIYTNFQHSETFVATGNSATFNLNYAPTRDKSKISITKNGQIVLNNEYEISLYKSSVDTYGLLKGRIRFVIAPNAGDIIEITYDKNAELFDSVNRIDRYYSPTSGMKGKELPQLMTGIDFGGVQIQGTTFDVTGGWDALPWFTDNWDSVESNSDYYYIADGSTTYVALPFVPTDGQPISIYIKKIGEQKSKRIDDPYWNVYDGSTVQPNGRKVAPADAVMPTFIGDGSTNLIQFNNPVTDQPYIVISAGDTLIFRNLESDGSVTITDVNLLDTRISAGTLDASGSTGTKVSLNTVDGAYTTATGFTPEEIVIDGDKFVSPDQVPAPEENVPGQIIDSVSIKVFGVADPGAAPLQSKIIIADGVTRSFDIGMNVVESASVMVYVDKVKQEYTGDSTISYEINFLTNQVEFRIAPPASSIIEILSIGIGGIGLLDYQEFIADGETNLYLTKASYQNTSFVVVTVDGTYIDTGFINSSDVIDIDNKTMIQFGIKPELNQTIKIVCLGTFNGTAPDTQNIIRVNQQLITFDGSTRSFQLDNFVNLSTASGLSSILVDHNGRQLKGVDTIYRVYDGTNNVIEVGVDPQEAIGTITSGNIKVYINNVLQRFVIDYVYNGNANIITIPQANLEINDVIRIVVDVRAEYTITNNIITFSDLLTFTPGDELFVTWFSEYPTMDIISDEYTGGKVQYQLQRLPLNASYVWIYKNGVKLTQERDYTISLPRGVVYLTDSTNFDDDIKIIQFSDKIYQPPKAYEIYKDMLNNYHYKRFSRNRKVRLAQDLNYFDTSIVVTDASDLSDPIPSRNIPGVIMINNEKIDYFAKNGNVLSQLRRGSLGTGIATVHTKDSFVVDLGYEQTVPYNETQEKVDFLSDGSSLLIGPLDYTPTKSNRNNWTRTTIPTEYGPCDEIEVFVAGKRLRKNPIDVYVEENGDSSPSADESQEAEFSVDGSSQYIRLTKSVSAGTRITVIRKQGRLWYDRGENSATTGTTFLRNTSAIATFIAEKSTELPE